MLILLVLFMRRRGAKTYCERSKVKKHLFTTQEKAEQYMMNLIMNARSIDGGLPQRVYYCESCGGWHMTSKSHILQQHIDDGSAVLNPKPIVLEKPPTNIILHEDRMQTLRNYYTSWERKCKSIQAKIEKQQIMSAKVDIDKLVKNRVEKVSNRFEKEFLTDWRKRLVEKTLLLRRRINNILDGNTRKNRPIAVAPVIKCRYVPTPPRIPNPMETIAELKEEVSVLFCSLDDPCFYSSLTEDKGCYTDTRKSVRRTSRFLLRNEDETRMAIACFSWGAEPLKSLVEGYLSILERTVRMREMAENEENKLAESRVNKLVGTIKWRLKLIQKDKHTTY